MKKKKIYRVKTQYIFEGVFEVLAESKEDARRKVLQDCGLVMGGSIYSTLPDEESNHSKGVNNSVLNGRHICRPLLSFVSRKKAEKKGAKKP